MTYTLIDEHSLDGFRRDRLAPEAILADIERHVAVLDRLPVGVGKSVAVDRLLRHPQLWERFGAVIYAAPTWQIIYEREIVKQPNISLVPSMVIKPRPRDLCGPFDEEWETLEEHSCSTYAKKTLCEQCRGSNAPDCRWPEQLKEAVECRLLFMTEQQIVLNRTLIPFLTSRMESPRHLVILDEARLLDASFEVVLSHDDVHSFREVLGMMEEVEGSHVWMASLEKLLDATDLRGLQLRFPARLNRDAYDIQSCGLMESGSDFRYLGYDLVLLAASHPGERWKTADGAIHFIARPYLGCHLLVLSAHLTGDYAGERLGRGPLPSPLEDLRFQHSGTRVINVRSRIGADRYFVDNHKQILDTIAVMIARNVVAGRTTLLVSRKKSKDRCAAYLRRRLADWGHHVRFVCAGYGGLPAQPDPRIVPVIHYGVMGVNTFTEYESAYCLNGYYISSRELSKAVQEAVPKQARRELIITSKPDCIRRVTVGEGPDPGGVLAHQASMYLRKLEVDPVIQAAGRVRFVTRPREVVLFQMNNLEADLGPYENVDGLAGLRGALDIPTAASLDAAVQLRDLKEMLAAGKTVEEAATSLGISRATAFRRLKAADSLKSPQNYIRRETETDGGARPSEGTAR